MNLLTMKSIGRSLMRKLSGPDVREAERLTLRERQRAEYIPTPAEIEAGCLAVQATWDEAERERRSGMRVMTWDVPSVRETDQEL